MEVLTWLANEGWLVFRVSGLEHVSGVAELRPQPESQDAANAGAPGIHCTGDTYGGTQAGVHIRTVAERHPQAPEHLS